MHTLLALVCEFSVHILIQKTETDFILFSNAAGKNMVSGKIGKLVGLDPALPLFSVKAVDERLAITDADYVETIHTSAGR